MDPTDRRQDEAFFCTDTGAAEAFILEGDARRWTLEVTFRDAKQYLGLADPQNQATRAVHRTAPFAFLVYDLVLLWYAERARTGAAADWLHRPWYRDKAAPSFPDMLTALRREGWHRYLSAPPSPARWPQNPPVSWPDAVLAAA